MGNEFCFSRSRPKKHILDDDELRSLRKLYGRLKMRDPLAYDGDFLTETSFAHLIPDRPHISLKIFKHIASNLPAPSKLNFDTFSSFVGRLLKIENQNRMTRVEFYAYISIQRQSDPEGDFGREKISFLDAFDLLMEIEFFLQEMGYLITDYEAQDESMARSVLSRLFSTNSGSVPFYELRAFLDANFPNLSLLLSKYFHSLFILQHVFQPALKFSKPSYLMNNSSFGYMTLTSSVLQEAESFTLLWNSSQQGWKFESLYQVLVGFKGPTLILIKFDDKTSGDDSDEEELKKSKQSNKTGKYSIVGALNAAQFIETNSYQGTSQNCLFQVYPKFTPLPTCNDVFRSKRPGSQNFSYLNVRDGKKGLGFGGVMKTFRLWLDAEHMQQSSYTIAEGEPYIRGDLIDPSIITASVTYLEVWGIGEHDKSINTSEKEIQMFRDSTLDLLEKYKSN